MPLSCAYTFPGVLLTVGVKEWDKFYFLYERLLKMNSIAVDKTLACALHEIAKIIGPKRTEKYLFNSIN